MSYKRNYDAVECNECHDDIQTDVIEIDGEFYCEDCADDIISRAEEEGILDELTIHRWSVWDLQNAFLADVGDAKFCARREERMERIGGSI